MRYFSTFSGVGGFELGIQQAYEKLCIENKEWLKEIGDTERPCGQQPNICDDGLTCIGYSEIDKYAIQVYNKHFNHKNYGDISKIDETNLPDFELLVGGFPCQSFSIAGKRGGFSDTRGTMFFEIARIVKQKQPRLLLLENVKGLLSHDKGRTFTTIISTLDELGYDCQWQVLNSKNFGVPQNRERVFIIGHLRGTSRPEVFPIGGTAGQNLKQVIGGMQGNRVYAEDGISCTLASQAGGQGPKTGLYFVNEPKFSKCETSDTAQTVKIGGTIGNVYEDAKIRRLTPKECERLQGFPDGWTDLGYEDKHFIQISDTQRYTMCGNAVTVNVIKSIMEKLL